MMDYGVFHEVSPLAIKGSGHLLFFLNRQNEGLSSHFKEQGYPFDTPMWNGGVGKIIPASVICHDRGTETPLQESWWPYEQSAYLLDGLLRLGILLNDQEKIALFEKNVKWLIEHPTTEGLLGHCYNDSASEWPMAVFFRAVYCYCEAAEAAAVREAFIRHFSVITPEQLSCGFRNINNLEGLLKVYEWTDDDTLLEKAFKAYHLHNQRNKSPFENEFELYWDRLTSGHNFVIHGVSFCEALKIPVMLSLYSKDSSWLQGAEKALKDVLSRHEQIPGLPSSNEDFAGRDPLQGYETCVITDFTWTLGYFLMATGKAEYADRIEKIIYNALPGSLTKDFKTLQYLSSPNQVIVSDSANHSFFYRGSATFRQFRSDHSAQCCTGNVHRALPNFLLRLWMKDHQNAPVAAMYGPSIYCNSFGGIDYSIEEVTEYPYAETILFCFHMRKTLHMPFTFRIPGWCKAGTVVLNGEKIDLSLKQGSYVTLKRIWKDSDILQIHLPMCPVQKTDRYWSWFECGPLVFTFPVPATEKRETDSPFSPRNFYPAGAWNYGVSPDTEIKIVRNAMTESPIEHPPVCLCISAFPVTGFDSLEQGRYTPELPLFCASAGKVGEIQLVPYASTNLRVTAFPDAVKREILPIYQVLATKTYPYNNSKLLSEQVFLPEFQKEEELLATATELQVDHSGYYDLIHHFGPQTNVLSYMLFRIWADNTGEAWFAVGASDGAECFINGEKIFTIEPPTDGEFMAPYWFRANVCKGYNILMLKVCEGPTLLQYRRAWGARVTVFR